VKIADLNRFLVPLRNRIVNMVARAVVQVVDDSAKMQLLQLGILDGETRDGLERLQEYGFTSVPEDGAEAVVLFPGGSRDHGLVIAVDDRRYRLKGLGAGEVAVYHKDGATITMKSNGSIEITPKAGADIVLNGGSLKVARVTDPTTGHQHTLTGTAGPYPIAGTAITATDTIASSAGAEQVKA
jgi:phage baseplate assembly protein V